jgi:mycofactocin precursor
VNDSPTASDTRDEHTRDEHTRDDDTPEPTEAEALVDSALLVEDVSIDGMCGVY